MSLSELSEKNRQIILQSLKAVLRGEFLENEFEARLGIAEERLNEIVAAFPEINDTNPDSDGALAINNSLNEVCYGISISEEAWKRWFDVGRSKVEEVYRRWAKLRGWSRTGIR